MIFPVGDDDIIGGHKPMVAYALLAINVMIFLFQITLNLTEIETLLTDYGSIPSEILNGEDLHTLMSSMFLHGGLMHLLGNMLFLWIFADNIEAIVGSPIFAVFYIVGGLFASFIHIYTNPASVIPTVGASGAISAVMGTYMVMFPKSRIKMIFFIFFRNPFYIPAVVFLGLWFGSQLVSGFSTYGAATSEEAAGVAWWAHIGGFIYGLIIGYVFKKLYSHKYSYNSPNKA